MNEELKVGDIVAYTVLGTVSPNYYGRVVGFIPAPSWSRERNSYVQVEFFATVENQMQPEHYSFGINPYPLDCIVKTEPYVTLTLEDKIKRKSKRLWNNSNYVKKHPQCAY